MCNACSGAPPAASTANENKAAKQQLWGPGFSWCLLVPSPSLWDVNPIFALLELLPRCSLVVGRTILVLGASLGERGVGCRDGGRMGGKAGNSMGERGRNGDGAIGLAENRRAGES